jgi:hypothetical protein
MKRDDDHDDHDDDAQDHGKIWYFYSRRMQAEFVFVGQNFCQHIYACKQYLDNATILFIFFGLRNGYPALCFAFFVVFCLNTRWQQEIVGVVKKNCIMNFRWVATHLRKPPIRLITCCKGESLGAQ